MRTLFSLGSLLSLFALGCAGGGDVDTAAEEASGSGAGATGGGVPATGAGGADLTAGSGGSGGAAEDVCDVGAKEDCYPGDAARIGVGACVGGKRTCIPSGEFGTWTECEGYVLPKMEICGDGIDDDCDGEADQGCCVPEDYTVTSGFTSNGGQVCCNAGDTAVAVIDCGDGDDHWVTQSGACGVAWEGGDNYGGPCVSVQCTKTCP